MVQGRKERLDCHGLNNIESHSPKEAAEMPA